VLAWESGFIDLERTEAGLRGDLDPVKAAQLGILKIWSASAECRPLFAYAKASHSGFRPLTMAGFDMQLTATGTLDYFAGELRAFVGTLDPTRRRQAEALAEIILNRFGRLNRYTDALATKSEELGRAGVTGPARDAAIQAWNQSEGDALRPVAADLAPLEDAASALDHLLRGGGTAAGTPAGRTGFMIRAIASLAGYGANLLEHQGSHSVGDAARYEMTAENRRDRINADNLRWLIDSAHAGRKVMVWAHNAHLMNAWYGRGFDSVSLEPLADGMKPTGIWLTSWYGNSFTRSALPPGKARTAGSADRPRRCHPLRSGASKNASTGLTRPRFFCRCAASPGQCPRGASRCASPNIRWKLSPSLLNRSTHSTL
jgi:hypothetical protein